MEVQDAAGTPRVHCQGNETYVDERVPSSIHDELAERGHNVVAQRQSASSNHFGRVVAVHRAPNGVIRCGADPPGAVGARGY
jgi:gamma-glutamyltranspeptidase